MIRFFAGFVAVYVAVCNNAVASSNGARLVELEKSVRVLHSSTLIGSVKKCGPPPDEIGAWKWRDCMHSVGTGKSSLAVFKRGSSGRGVTDAGSTTWLSIEGPIFVDGPAGIQEVKLPARDYRVVLTECNLWRCRIGMNPSGSLFVERNGNDELFSVEVRGKPSGSRMDAPIPSIGIFDWFQ